ncbi:ImpE protein [Thalassoglobus neptunius]|uniref:ImpE protein n=1 Tax=Thalassoglobus neptunius TaxID=1938619 RepID=A0A5C5WH16_9PLAN|nr:type VI secretion system accessory protein TagJ [Thalassoglobus neptunius]TWT50076.1 ImpE protein [Thalassoglobus neptunius]
MTTPIELFQQGKLGEAVALAADDVRSTPGDITKRSLYCELLCFTRDWERADKQLEAITKIDKDAMIGAAMIRHLIRCEVAREEVFEQGRVPEFIKQPSESTQKRLEALTCLREGDVAAAVERIQQASEAESELTGKCNREAFQGIRDLDDLMGPILEVFTATGEYYWVNLDEIDDLEFDAPNNLVDQLWRKARIKTVGELSGRICVPAIYFDSASNEDGRVHVGRATDWVQKVPDGPVCGQGQRELLVGEDVKSIMEVTEIVIERD